MLIASLDLCLCHLTQVAFKSTFWGSLVVEKIETMMNPEDYKP